MPISSATCVPYSFMTPHVNRRVAFQLFPLADIHIFSAKTFFLRHTLVTLRAASLTTGCTCLTLDYGNLSRQVVSVILEVENLLIAFTSMNVSKHRRDIGNCEYVFVLKYLTRLN